MSLGSINKKVALGAAVAILAVGGAWQFKANQANDNKPQSSQGTTQVPTTIEAPKPTEYVTYQGVEGKTALELLKGQANVQTESSEYGEFVKSINGSDGGGTKYWTFLVDGKEASVGAGTYVTKNGEKIEWKLQ